MSYKLSTFNASKNTLESFTYDGDKDIISELIKKDYFSSITVIKDINDQVLQKYKAIASMPIDALTLQTLENAAVPTMYKMIIKRRATYAYIYLSQKKLISEATSSLSTAQEACQANTVQIAALQKKANAYNSLIGNQTVAKIGVDDNPVSNIKKVIDLLNQYQEFIKQSATIHEQFSQLPEEL